MPAVDLTSPSLGGELTPHQLDGLGDHRLSTGDYGDALRAYQKSHDLRRQGGTLSLEHRVDHAFRVGRLFLKLGRFEQAQGRCDEGLTLLGGQHPAKKARLVALSGLIACSSGSFETAREKIDQGLALLETAPDSLNRWKTEGSLRRTEGNLEIGLGNPRAAVRAYEQSHRLWKKVIATGQATRDDLWQHSIALFNLGDAYTFSGDYDAASPLLDQAQEAKAELEDRWGLAFVHLAKARISLDRRDFTTALQEVEAGLEHAQAINEPKITTRLECHHGFCQLRTGDLDDAERSFQSAQLTSQLIGHCPEAAMAKVGLAAVHRLRSEPQAAARHLQSAEAIAQRFGDAEVRFAIDLEQGRQALANDEHAAARKALDRALAWCEEVGNAFRRMEVLVEISTLEIVGSA